MCAAAREAVERGRGMGHLWVLCDTCHGEQWSTTFYEPPHDPRSAAETAPMVHRCRYSDHGGPSLPSGPGPGPCWRDGWGMG